MASPPSQQTDNPDLAHPAVVNFGHLTSIQVRGGAARGLRFHVWRMAAAHAELFDSSLDLDLVRSYWRSVLLDRGMA